MAPGVAKPTAGGPTKPATRSGTKASAGSANKPSAGSVTKPPKRAATRRAATDRLTQNVMNAQRAQEIEDEKQAFFWAMRRRECRL